MATKMQQILGVYPQSCVLFGDWMTKQGVDSKLQHAYMKSGWLTRISKSVYVLQSAVPTLMQTIAAYNNQLSKQCVVGAYTALELRDYAHYASIGKPNAYLFTDKASKLPSWILERDWDMTVRYMTTSFLGNDLKGVEHLQVNDADLLVSSPERAILECLYLPDAASSLLDIYYIMEGLTTLRPNLLQSLLETCSSQKVRRLFIYMAEKAGHPWFKALNLNTVPLGTCRYMIVPTGRYIAKYNITIPKELAEYEYCQ